MASVKAYADAYVTDAYRDDSMAFVQPDDLFQTLERLICAASRGQARPTH